MPEGDGFRKVELPQTYGVVTHPYTMSALAYHHLSSPIHRGVFVTRRLLGRTLKPPPQATEFKDAEFDPHMTTREKVAKLTGSTACQTCHVIINPLGFSLENYDAVGRYREREGERPIDVTADFPSISGEQVRLEGAKSLAQLIADSQHAQKHFVDQMFHQAVKQPINAYGDKVRDELADSFASHDYNIRELLAEIATLAAMHEISD